MMITEVFMNSGAASFQVDQKGKVVNERRVTCFRELNEFEKQGLTPTSTVDHGKDQWLYFDDGKHMGRAEVREMKKKVQQRKTRISMNPGMMDIDDKDDDFGKIKLTDGEAVDG